MNPKNYTIYIPYIPLPSSYNFFLFIAVTATYSGLAIGLVDIIRVLDRRYRRRMFGHNQLDPGQPQFWAQLGAAAPAAIPPNQPQLGFEWGDALGNAAQAGHVAGVAALLAATRRTFPGNGFLSICLFSAFTGLGIGIIDIIRQEVRWRMSGQLAAPAIPHNQPLLGFGGNNELWHAAQAGHAEVVAALWRVQNTERSMRALLQAEPELLWHRELTPLIVAKQPSVDKILNHFASAPAVLKSLWLYSRRLEAGPELAKILAAVPRQVQYLLLPQDLLDKIAIKGMCKDIDFCHATTDADQRQVLTEQGIEDLINAGDAIILKRNDPNKPSHFYKKLDALTKSRASQLHVDMLDPLSKFLTFRDAAKVALSGTLPNDPAGADLSQFKCKIDNRPFLFC